jgi:hypothetical protein
MPQQAQVAVEAEVAEASIHHIHLGITVELEVAEVAPEVIQAHFS